MVNLVKTKYDKITGLAIGLQCIGENTHGNQIDEGFALAQLSISELVAGQATLNLPYGFDNGDFVFAPPAHTEDPEGKVGWVNYTRIKNLITPITQEHDLTPPVVDNPLANRVRELEAKLAALAPVALVSVFDGVNLREYTRPDGTRHYGFHFFNNNNAEFEFATGQFTYGVVKVSDSERYLRVRTYNELGAVVQELRANVATNDFAGFDYLMNGLVKTHTGAFAFNELLVAESKARDAGGTAGGGASGGGESGGESGGNSGSQ